MSAPRIPSDPVVRDTTGAFLLEITGHAVTGHADTRHTMDPAIRTNLLSLNSADDAAYTAAVAWLEEKVANPVA